MSTSGSDESPRKDESEQAAGEREDAAKGPASETSAPTGTPVEGAGEAGTAADAGECARPDETFDTFPEDPSALPSEDPAPVIRAPQPDGEAAAATPSSASPDTPSDLPAVNGETLPEVPADSEAEASVPAVAGGGDGEPPAPPAVPASGDGADGEAGDDEEEDEEESGAGRMSLFEHLGELRTRVLRCIIAALVGMMACWGVKERILDALMAPMMVVLKAAGESHFVYLEPAEAFFTYMKASMIGGLVLVSPYIFYQFWRFIAPGLYAHERRWLMPISLASAVLFVGGASFGYFVVFPFGFEYFASFISPQLQFLPALSTYFGFCVKLLVAFGLIFELPLFVLFLARLGLVTAQGMKRFRRWAILMTFIVAAILTPPDPFSQVAMALPLLALYEISIVVAKVFGRKPKKEPEPEEDVEEERGGEEA
ncbi:Sec-independent protein translocase, TatC subunit [Desulfovibrio sp. X2]|uniref:twin-arginine translocase subunit TatC n=1 Tax=Desulfovibrio sp. X2 TaxID=941449 RepID=UPI0003588799|nr:twin-arginine translocase subunit TatC [Desulfovibrio sp. X2]EPR42813.1 Sec-independent protein translocase, TatC subunit [Desulfovibrio sp. X2]